jgi:hypothetical protein
MRQLVQGCSVSSSTKHEAAGSSSNSTMRGTGWQLQPVQAAGLLAPVLHLLSAVVLHVLGPPGEGAVTAADPRTSDLAGCFAALVGFVVVPGALGGWGACWLVQRWLVHAVGA